MVCIRHLEYTYTLATGIIKASLYSLPQQTQTLYESHNDSKVVVRLYLALETNCIYIYIYIYIYLC
jgi:hypothetical protein